MLGDPGLLDVAGAVHEHLEPARQRARGEEERKAEEHEQQQQSRRRQGDRGDAPAVGVPALADQGVERLGYLGQLGVKRNGGALSAGLQLLERARRRPCRFPPGPRAGSAKTPPASVAPE